MEGLPMYVCNDVSYASELRTSYCSKKYIVHQMCHDKVSVYGLCVLCIVIRITPTAVMTYLIRLFEYMLAARP